MKSSIYLVFFIFQMVNVQAQAGKCKVQTSDHSFHMKDGNIYRWPKLKSGRKIETFCSEGYKMILNGQTVASTEMECLIEGPNWNQPFPTCMEINPNCTVPEIDHGYFCDQGKQITGDTVESKNEINFQVDCDSGYQPSSSAWVFNITCINGNWIGAFPTCEEVICVVPPIENGQKTVNGQSVSEVGFGDTVVVQCLPGFSLYHEDTGDKLDSFSANCTGAVLTLIFLECRPDGCTIDNKWREDFRLAIEGTEHRNELPSPIEHGHRMQTFCKEPLSTMTCSNGNWTGDIIPCIRNEQVCLEHQQRCTSGQCIRTTLWCDGIVDCQDMSDETKCVCEDTKKACENGICMDKALFCNTVNDCLDGSDEIGCDQCKRSEAVCEHLFASDGPEVHNGEDGVHGNEYRMECGHGQLPSSFSAFCINGHWLDHDGNPVPQCTTVKCTAPVPIRNVALVQTQDEYVYSDIVNVKECHGNQEFVGAQQITCLSNGSWSGEAMCHVFCPNGKYRYTEKNNQAVKEKEDAVVYVTSYKLCLDECFKYQSFRCRSVTYWVDRVKERYVCLLYKAKVVESEQMIEERSFHRTATIYCKE